MEGWPARVAERLVGSGYGSQAAPVIGSGPGRDPTLRDLRRALEEGLPVEALDRITGEICPDPDEALRLKHAVIPRTTLRRRSRLTLEEGERTERLARLLVLAEEVWEDGGAAREFLLSPQPQLGDERPVDLARSELGVREVEELLHRIEHALPG